MTSKSGFIDMRMRFTDDGGLLFNHLKSLPANARTDRVRSLALTGLLFEMGIRTGTPPSPGNVSASAMTSSQSNLSQAAPIVPQDEVPQRTEVVAFPPSDVDEWFLK